MKSSSSVSSSASSSAIDRYEGLRASPPRKLLCALYLVFNHLFWFWLSRSRVEFLDDIPDLLFPSIALVARSWLKAFVDHMNSQYSPLLLATVCTIVVHQVIYWALSLPDFLYQFIPFMRRYKIQDRDVPYSMQWDCFKTVMFNQWVIEFPIIFANYFFTQFLHYGWTYDELPRWYQILGGLMGCVAIEDTWHFYIHWICHKGFMYRRVHKLHHKFVTPIGMQAEYAHPVEILILGIGFALGCGIYCSHFYMTWMWLLIRQWETVEVHSGYDLPLLFNPLHYLPFYGGPKFHDFHHSNFVGNYASTYTYWDELFETDIYYREFLRKQNENKDRKTSNTTTKTIRNDACNASRTHTNHQRRRVEA